MALISRAPRARRRPRVSWARGASAAGVIALAAALAACGNSSSSSSPTATGSSSAATGSSPSATGASSAPATGKVGGSLTVWVDAVRLPAAQAYAKAHPNVNVKIVTFDGDGNGATTMQTKIQLWNRTGSGWPDVIFSEQVNDPVWMAEKPFDFAEPVKGLIPDSVLSQWPAPSTAQCTVNGTQVCVQDNLAQVVLWVNKKLMDQFGYTVPTTWQQWAALGQKVATEHPGYIVGNIGDSFSHWIYLWGDQCPLEQLTGSQLLINAADTHCTRMASLLDPLIKGGALPPLSVFTPDFAKKYGGAADKVLMMPGPSWYATSLFRDTLHIPAGQITAATPLQWENEPITTGQVGGGPWIISKHSTNLATAADFVTWATTVYNPDPTGANARAGYPAYAPVAAKWLAGMATNSYFAADPTPALKAAAADIWKGWSIVTYPDQPVWSNTVVTGLVAGKSLSSLLPAFGSALAQAAQAAGYQVTQ
ncbi:carbohydrate ABC transporter substrate-binding protein [Trebonia kvetii]|uniref:Carbohydrate ABC transporter substrate-binding protein n=1 Tax=Trebonia kvetii TaxID=2480626 RepID=A0A6P2C8C4_9ACTN|nr:carbohydrate ABC transporter substrate-binding protein [Trebonia kvetii]